MKRVSKSGCFNGNRRLCRNMRKVENRDRGKEGCCLDRKKTSGEKKKEKEE